MTLITTFLFIFGLCVGSFLNVLIYRLPHSLPITGRSFCPKCKKKIAWYDNIPLLSFIVLRGRCRNCHSPIFIQYPLVELVTGILTLAIFNFQSASWRTIFNQFTHLQLPSATADGGQAIFEFLITLAMVYSLIVIFVIDLRYEIIPDQVIYPAILMNLFLLVSQYPKIEISNLISGLLAGLFFLSLFLLTRGRGMGFGDVKLSFLMGLFLGFPKIVVALYLAFLTGAVIGVILVLRGKKKFGEAIAFGPFLAASTIVSLFYGGIIWEKLIAVLP